MPRSEKTKDSYIWTAFVAFMFLGLGLGIYFNQAAPGILIGMGLGFLAVVLLKMKK